MPEFGHLPFVMGEGNKKLSKRDPEAHALAYRDQGFLPEGLLNYLALLGWAIAADRDVFTMDEMVAAFDIKDVNPNPARFDIKKADAINSSHMRLLSVDEITDRVLPFLKDAGVVSDPVSDADAQLLELAMPLVAERINKLTEAVDMLGFLFVDEAAFTRDEADVEKLLNDDGRAVVARALRHAARRSASGRRPRSRTRCRPSWSTRWGSSRATRSARCGSPSPAAGSRRRCSSRWSCSAASAASAGCRARWADRVRQRRAAVPPRPPGRAARRVAPDPRRASC